MPLQSVFHSFVQVCSIRLWTNHQSSYYKYKNMYTMQIHCIDYKVWQFLPSLPFVCYCGVIQVHLQLFWGLNFLWWNNGNPVASAKPSAVSNVPKSNEIWRIISTLIRIKPTCLTVLWIKKNSSTKIAGCEWMQNVIYSDQSQSMHPPPLPPSFFLPSEANCLLVRRH